jgi:transformation/transcription domain-associated protein
MYELETAKLFSLNLRVTSVYFKSLYSPSPEVKDVAHEGLRTHQSQLPKELLQTGLRPILMNFSRPKTTFCSGFRGTSSPFRTSSNKLLQG